MRRSMFAVGAAISAAGLVAGLVATSYAQQQQPQQAPPAGVGGFPDLVGGLKATPGCLGVETAQTSSGKNVIFAWFESKQACLDWYYSPMHKGVSSMFFPERPDHKPLADVPDDIGPLMVIASITFTDKPQVDGTQLPISQIAIEVYAPVSGGLHAGGRFAPETLQVQGLRDVGSEE